MWPYWLLFSVCTAGAIQYRHSREGYALARGPLLTAALVAIAILVGFRMEVGGDWTAYLGHFQFYSRIDLEDVPGGRLDPGYGLVNWLVAHAGLTAVWVNVFSAIVFCWGLRIFLRSQPSPWLALVVAVPYLVIVVAMGYTRQSVAIGFLFAGLVDFQRTNSLVRLAFYIAAGALFHKTVVVMFPIIALAQDRHPAVKISMLFALGIGLYYSFAASAAESLYNNYVVEEYDAAGAAIRLSMNAVPAAIFLLMSRRFGMSELERKVWRNISICSLVMLAALPLFSSSVFLDRLGLYLLPIQMVVFARLPFTSRSAPYNGRMTLGVSAVYAAVLLVWLTTGSNSEWWLPYEFYRSTPEQEVRLEEDALDEAY